MQVGRSNEGYVACGNVFRHDSKYKVYFLALKCGLCNCLQIFLFLIRNIFCFSNSPSPHFTVCGGGQVVKASKSQAIHKRLL